jgi:tetratricopeptide (TPR) repeat protein
MASPRIEMLLGFIQQKPHDPFPRYALALEFKNAARLAEAKEQFDILMREHPDYTVGYLHAGNLSLAMGERAAAASIYRVGIDVCVRRGDAHARGELEGALAAIAGAA